MATYVNVFKGNFEEFQCYLIDSLENSSYTLALSGKRYLKINDIECMVYVFERFSSFSSNYVSMNITLLYHDGIIELTAITAGGSSSLLRIDNYGEETFLETLIEPVEKYIQQNL